MFLTLHRRTFIFIAFMLGGLRFNKVAFEQKLHLHLQYNLRYQLNLVTRQTIILRPIYNNLIYIKIKHLQGENKFLG